MTKRVKDIVQTLQRSCFWTISAARPGSANEPEVLIAERYERRSLGITSNLVFSEWERIFANPIGHRRGDRPGGPPRRNPRF